VTAGQLALAWVMSRGDDVVPIPGTKHVKYLEQNAKAADIKLSREELDRIDDVFPVGVAMGTRYPDMSTVNR
jgi:aryl-alcohol dehydrogenase-like predicted oxidoreductase